MSAWQRSAAIPYPKIWGEFLLFSPHINEITSCEVMDITENYYDTVINNLSGIAVANTPNILQPALSTDEVSVAERVAFFRRVLEQRLSLMCVVKQSDGSEVIVGAMINVRRSQFDPLPEFQGKAMKWTSALEEYIYGKRPFYEHFEVTEVITYTTGYVVGGYSDKLVLMHMFKCSGLLCQATGIKLSLGYFPKGIMPNPMQDAAIITGFKAYLRLPYEELASLDRSFYLPLCEYVTLMYNLYE